MIFQTNAMCLSNRYITSSPQTSSPTLSPSGIKVDSASALESPNKYERPEIPISLSYSCLLLLLAFAPFLFSLLSHFFSSPLFLYLCPFYFFPCPSLPFSFPLIPLLLLISFPFPLFLTLVLSFSFPLPLSPSFTFLCRPSTPTCISMCGYTLSTFQRASTVLHDGEGKCLVIRACTPSQLMQSTACLSKCQQYSNRVGIFCYSSYLSFIFSV